MTGREFLSCAERLALSSIEADLRSAVSRAYYGAFHEVLSLLHDCGVWLPKTEQVHIKMGFCLRDCGDEDADNIGRQLEALRTKRRVADYDLDDNRFTSPSAVRSEIVRANKVLGSISEIRSGSVPELRAKVRAQAKLLGLPVSD